MPIPYMGSKRKSADKIYALISQREPQADTLVDLFCGGFAVGEKFLKKGWKVIANDKNKYVIALIDQTINKGLDEKIVTQFVTRAKFQDVIAKPDKYDDWYVGYVMCIWSFGNNNKRYLFGKDIEPIKHAGHKLVVDKDPTDIQRVLPQIPQRWIDGILRQPDWHKRRMALVKVAKTMQHRPLELQQLEQLQQLQQLEQLQRLQQLERLATGDYRNISIPDGAVVYCDPPYKGTEEYVEGGFNHDEFWQWVREQSKNNPVYVSEYSAPEDFICIRSFPQKSTLQGGHQEHRNQPDEKIFIYEKR